MAAQKPFVDQVADATGLSRVIVRSVLTRVCGTHGLVPDAVTEANFAVIHADLARALRFFLRGDALAKAEAALEALARAASRRR